MIIDAHQHFWRYTPDEYGWIDDRLAALRRDFLPGDLAPVLKSAGIDGCIAVQARQSLEETRWLQSLAKTNPFILGVVAWVPLVNPGIEAILDTVIEGGSLVGVRHVLQGEADPLYALSPAFRRGISCLARRNLSYDILVYHHQLPQAIALVDGFPDQRFVLDHLGKPPVSSQNLEPWASDLAQLAERPNVYCKLSGLVTEDEASPQQTGAKISEALRAERLLPYLEHTVSCFGADRVMFASDWPVLTADCPYGQWLSFIEGFSNTLSAHEREQLFWKTAVSAYNLIRFRP